MRSTRRTTHAPPRKTQKWSCTRHLPQGESWMQRAYPEICTNECVASEGISTEIIGALLMGTTDTGSTYPRTSAAEKRVSAAQPSKKNFLEWPSMPPRMSTGSPVSRFTVLSRLPRPMEEGTDTAYARTQDSRPSRANDCSHLKEAVGHTTLHY